VAQPQTECKLSPTPVPSRVSLQPSPSWPHLPDCCSNAVASGRAAEFKIGSTLGALGRHAQGLLESAMEGPGRWAHEYQCLLLVCQRSCVPARKPAVPGGWGLAARTLPLARFGGCLDPAAVSQQPGWALSCLASCRPHQLAGAGRRQAGRRRAKRLYCLQTSCTSMGGAVLRKIWRHWQTTAPGGLVWQCWCGLLCADVCELRAVHCCVI
jgi:hypothetical protein